jgi:hypothetical protein
MEHNLTHLIWDFLRYIQFKMAQNTQITKIIKCDTICYTFAISSTIHIEEKINALGIKKIEEIPILFDLDMPRGVSIMEYRATLQAFKEFCSNSVGSTINTMA